MDNYGCFLTGPLPQFCVPFKTFFLSCQMNLSKILISLLLHSKSHSQKFTVGTQSPDLNCSFIFVPGDSSGLLGLCWRGVPVAFSVLHSDTNTLGPLSALCSPGLFVYPSSTSFCQASLKWNICGNKEFFLSTWTYLKMIDLVPMIETIFHGFLSG